MQPFPPRQWTSPMGDARDVPEQVKRHVRALGLWYFAEANAGRATEGDYSRYRLVNALRRAAKVNPEEFIAVFNNAHIRPVVVEGMDELSPADQDWYWLIWIWDSCQDPKFFLEDESDLEILMRGESDSE